MHLDPPRLDRLACACTSLRKASRAVTRLYDEAMGKAGLSIAQFAMLRHIARHEPAPLVRLAELLVMDRTTLYRGLAPLERDGLVVIEAGKGRTKTARLSEPGRQAMADATAAWQGVQEFLLGRIGVQEWSALARSLDRLVTIAGEQAA